MVSPVTTYKARERSVYLAGQSWYDFWTGQSIIQSVSIDGILMFHPISAPAAYDQIPLHVRAGSIIPLGPDIQYTTEKKADRLPSMSTPAKTENSRSTKTTALLTAMRKMPSRESPHLE
jgi:alpha-D-xyloside xylohydrolase